MARPLLKLLSTLRSPGALYGALALLLLMLSAAASASAAITMIYPQPGSAVTQSRHLVLKLGSTNPTAVIITVNGVATDPLPIGTTEYKRAFRDFLILQPLWDKGSNQVTVETFADDKKLESFKADIFFAPKGEDMPIPKGFSPAVMHQPEYETHCTPCHNMRPTEKQLSSQQDKDNPCFSCHKRMANLRYVHGPVGTYTCTYCHSIQGTPLYSTPKRETKLCFDCHTEKQKELKGFKFLHGPVAGGMCEICHDPHGSENPFQLNQQIDKLCLSCHELVGKGVHVTTMSDGSGHPISGKTDLSERGKGRDLSCISCHDPHGGNARYYYVTGNDNKMALCQMCHNK